MQAHRLLVLATAFSTACLGPNPYLDADDESSTPEDGVLWCVELPGATVNYLGGGSASIWENPLDPPPHLPPTGCACAHEELDAFLNGLDVGPSAEITFADQEDWENGGGEGQGPLTFRNAVWETAEDNCEKLVLDHYTNVASNNCINIIDRTEPTVTPIDRIGDVCTVMVAYGEEEGMLSLPDDSWSDYFALNSVITYNSGLDLYVIDGAFFNTMLETPAWLIEDGVYIDLDGTDFTFYGVTSGTVAHALGIQTGDIPLTLNNIDVSTVEGAFEAWGSLQEDTEFELVLSRGMSTVTLEYEIVFTY